MIQEISPYKFDNMYREPAPDPEDPVFIFDGPGRKDDRVVFHLSADNVISLPSVEEVLAACPEGEDHLRYLFSIDATKFYMLERIVPKALPEGYTWEILRSVRNCSPKWLCFAATTAYHLYGWNRDNRFCGRCGHTLVHDHKLRAFKCPSCGNMVFPKICPAVIIGLTDGDSICTSTYANRTGSAGRALLAGFCEIGESAEETVAREVMEEVGLRVKNIRFYKSQPWGFESDLLLGYYCEVDGDTDIVLDEEELESAQFTKRSELEEISNLNSLTATMIEAFRRGEV